MGVLYDLSFAFFVFLTGASVLASGASLGYQALFSAPDEVANWNVIAIAGSYVALAIISLGIYVSRKITTVRNMRQIPKGYMPLEDGDVPRSVTQLLSMEYDRVCAIAGLSQPAAEFQEGWGTPGTALEGIYFRQAMLDSLLDVDREARILLPSYPSMRPHETTEGHFKPLEHLINLQEPGRLQKYNVLIEKARYSENEPDESDYEECNRLSRYIIAIFKFVSEAGQYYPPTSFSFRDSQQEEYLDKQNT